MNVATSHQAASQKAASPAQSPTPDPRVDALYRRLVKFDAELQRSGVYIPTDLEVLSARKGRDEPVLTVRICGMTASTRADATTDERGRQVAALVDGSGTPLAAASWGQEHLYRIGLFLYDLFHGEIERRERAGGDVDLSLLAADLRAAVRRVTGFSV